MTSTVTQHGSENNKDDELSHSRATFKAAMMHLRAQQSEDPAIGQFAASLESNLGHINLALTSAITKKVTAYTDPKATPLLSNATAGALKAFTESLRGPSDTGPRVDEYFRNLGHNEALRDQELIDLHQAIQTGVRESWKVLSEAALIYGLGTADLAHLGNSIFTFADHLLQKVDDGRASALRRTANHHHALLTAIREGTSPERLTRLAGDANWQFPQYVVAIALQHEGIPQSFPLPNGVLTSADGTLLLAPLALRDLALSAATKVSPAGPVSVSWPVTMDHASQAISWTERVLNLVERKVILPAPVIWCEEYRTEIWLHAEPALRQRLCQDLLLPLLAETPNSREILSETLLAWLETRDSAPAIASFLGVHPQTVRYRWKRINELFGEHLHDPEFIVQITMLLKASLPLWRAGDQSDFERFVAEQEGTS